MLLFAATLTTMVSCSKESSYETRIVGTWENLYMAHFSGTGTIPVGSKFQFTEEGLTTFPLGIALIYEVNGNLLIINDAQTIDIDELTNTTMKLSSEVFDRQITLKKVN